MEFRFEQLLDIVRLKTGQDPMKKSRKRHICDAKKIFSYLSYEYINRSTYSSIARFLQLNHATVIYNYKSAKDLIQTDKDFKHLTNSCIDYLHKKYDSKEFYEDIVSLYIKEIERKTNKKVVLINE